MNRISTGLNSPTYPPHNGVKINDNEYVIEMAAAGIDPEKLDISLEDSNLTISYTPEKRDVEYVHKGISEKPFRKGFTLHEYVIVDGADVVNGVLTINLRVEIPEEKKPRKIEITGNKQLLQE
jgi:molecular chaperone IbpA